MQDGPAVWLICRIRFLVCVTEADQGAQVIATRCKKQKLIRDQKVDQGYIRYWYDATHSRQESQRQINQTERPIRRSLQPSERHEHRISTVHQLLNSKIDNKPNQNDSMKTVPSPSTDWTFILP